MLTIYCLVWQLLSLFCATEASGGIEKTEFFSLHFSSTKVGDPCVKPLPGDSPFLPSNPLLPAWKAGHSRKDSGVVDLIISLCFAPYQGEQYIRVVCTDLPDICLGYPFHLCCGGRSFPALCAFNYYGENACALTNALSSLGGSQTTIQKWLGALTHHVLCAMLLFSLDVW